MLGLGKGVPTCARARGQAWDRLQQQISWAQRRSYSWFRRAARNHWAFVVELKSFLYRWQDHRHECQIIDNVVLDSEKTETHTMFVWVYSCWCLALNGKEVCGWQTEHSWEMHSWLWSSPAVFCCLLGIITFDKHIAVVRMCFYVYVSFMQMNLIWHLLFNLSVPKLL